MAGLSPCNPARVLATPADLPVKQSTKDIEKHSARSTAVAVRVSGTCPLTHIVAVLLSFLLANNAQF